jgi:glycosyltransferase involved in cell wall biosynthesis
MRIIASTVVRNESDRYLRSCLEWNSVWWDELFVYDDQSTDDTVAVCTAYTDHVVTRPDSVPSFLEHEGEYRSAAWAEMERRLDLTSDDWVFSFDADEFLCGINDTIDLKWGVHCTAVMAMAENYHSVNIQIPEMWSLDPMMRRVDGYWGDQMSRPELTRYHPEWYFRDKRMGCGSVPTHSYRRPLRRPYEELGIALVHVGHACLEDRRERYNRYMALPAHGHNSKHIASLLRTPMLTPWTGQVPNVWRGQRLI